MNKNAPVIRFQGFHDDWEQRKLGEVADIVGGGTPSTTEEDYWNGDIDWYTPAEIGDSIYVSHSEKTITKLGLSKSSAKLLPVGTILFTSRAGIGNTAILGKSSTTNQGFQSIVPDENRLDTYFIFSLSKMLKKYGEKMGAGSTFLEVSGKTMSKMTIYLPDVVEQHQIGTFFKHFDNLITLHQRKLNLLKEQKKSLLQKMFPKKDEKIPEIRFNGFTDDWEQRKVRELFIVTRGQVLAVSEVSSIKTLVNPYPVYSSQTKNNGLLGYYHDYLFDGGITWTTDGANAGTVKYRKGRFYSTNVNGVLLSNDGYINKALAEILNKSAWKYVSHVGNPKLMNNVMSDIKIEIPTKISEQQKLSGLIDKLDNLITLHQRKLDALQEQKKGLLQKMFV